MADGTAVVERDGHPRQCTAKAKGSGVRCRAFAIVGGTVCRSHGGGSPAVRRAAELRKAQAQADAMLKMLWDQDAAPVTNPIASLQRLAGRLEHAVEVLGGRLEGADLDGPTGLAWTRVVRELRLSLDGMARLNLEERMTLFHERQAQFVVNAFVAAIDYLRPAADLRSGAVGLFLEGLGVADADVAVPAMGSAAGRLMGDEGGRLANVVRRILDRLDLSPEQWAAARQVVPEEFRGVGDVDEGEVVRGEVE